MHLFYHPFNINNTIQLDPEESRHCIAALRHSKGDMVNLIDGTGGFYKGEIINADKRACEIKILERQNEFNKRNYYLHIAIAPTKNMERFEWFAEKATEAGIDEITPLICEFSERKNINSERLNKVLVSSMKQSMSAYLPKLNGAESFRDFILKSVKAQKLICSCSSNNNSTLKNLGEKKNYLFVIGPEGDFSENELMLAQANGYTAISLGAKRLRTETAGIYICSVISFLNQ